MRRFEDYPRFVFRAAGLWSEDKVVTFYSPKDGGSSSAVLPRDGVRFDAPCFTLKSLMEANGHRHIDVLKMDIEGAALPAMRRFFEDGIFPDQIVTEFERPRGDMSAVRRLFDELDQLNATAAERGYEMYLIPRKRHSYYSVELLYVRLGRSDAGG